MPKNVKFGTLKVSCEGFDSENDPYVLVGSCQLRYTLDMVTAAKTKKSSTIGGIVGGVLGFLIVILIIMGIVWCMRSVPVVVT